MINERPKDDAQEPDKVGITLPGTVEKIIPPISSKDPEKAQIAVHGADDLYREIRVENTLEDKDGNPVRLKEGAQVDVTIEAEPEGTVPLPDTKESDPGTPKAKSKAAD